jgi:hypothetical protein
MIRAFEQACTDEPKGKYVTRPMIRARDKRGYPAITPG